MSTNTSNANEQTGSGTTDSGNGNGGSGRGDNTQQTGSSSRNNNRNGRFNTRSNNGRTTYDPALKSFEGAEPEVGGVLCLPSEKVDKRVTFDEFRIKVGQYVDRNYDNPDDVGIVLEEMDDPTPLYKSTKPTALTENEKKSSEADELKIEYGYRLKKWVDRGDRLKVNLSKIFSLIVGQCTDSLRSILENLDDFKARKRNGDIVWLLEHAKISLSGITQNCNKRHVFFNCLRRLLNLTQGENESIDSFLKRFNSTVQTVRLVGGSHVFCSPDILGSKIEDATTTEIAKEEDAILSMIFLSRSDQTRFGDLLTHLETGATLGRDEYPITLTSTFALLTKTEDDNGSHRQVNNNRNRNRTRNPYNVQFAQTETPNPGTDGVLHSEVTCYHCQTRGHYSNQCPRRGERQLLQFGWNLAQSTSLPPSWVLLDTCSTRSCTNDMSILKNIRKCSHNDCVELVTNGGKVVFSSKGDCTFLPMELYYNRDSLATIISVKDVGRLPGFTLTMDTSVEKAILLHCPDSSIIKFCECRDGLYYYDLSTNSKMDVTNYSFLQSVKSNKLYYTAAQIAGARRARTIQEQLGWPSTTSFLNIVNNNLIDNSNINADDIRRAQHIFGTPTPLLQGKMTRTPPPSMRKVERLAIPAPILDRHKDLQLFVDFFFVNGHPFLHSKCNKINFLTVQHCQSRSKQHIIGGISTVLYIYKQRGFNITELHGDNEFNMADLESAIRPAHLIIAPKEAHVGTIERSIRTIKERVRCMYHAVPYTRITKLMTKYMIENAVKCLNSFPSKGSVSTTLSPATIVLGIHKPDMNVKRISYGSYAMVYIGTKNTLKARSVPGIALKDSNDTGGFYFMSLFTGKKIHSYKWEELPITDEVIARVEELATIEKQPKMNNGLPIFEWEPGFPITDDHEHDNNDEGEVPEIDIIDDLQDDVQDAHHNNNEGVSHIISDDDFEDYNSTHSEEEVYEINENNDGLNENVDILLENNLVENNDASSIIHEQEKENDEMTNDNDDETPNNNNDDNDYGATQNDEDNEHVENEQHEDVVNERPQRSNAGQGVQRLQPSFDGKIYHDKKIMQYTQYNCSDERNESKNENVSYMRKAVDVVFTQMTAKRGIKLFGEKAVAAMVKEFTQLDKGAFPGNPVVGPIDPTILTQEDKIRAMEAVNLIKEKRCGKIKGRTCANGSVQRKFLKDGESVASPTVSVEALFSTLIIDSMENRDIATFDVPGAYLHAEMPKDKNELLRLRGEFVDIMCQVNPAYKPFVIEEKGKKVLYMKILRAIYGCIQSALLWYELYTSVLEGMGFTVNPYDRCVANSMINGKQCTIVFYVDDNKVSHTDPSVVTNVIEKIEKYFGEMTKIRGKEHDYLGMKLKINEDKSLEIDMRNQIDEIIEFFGEDIDESVASPAALRLFEVDETAAKLGTIKAEKFHSITAKLLYLEKRARPDLETVVSFLCTRVTKCNVQDWKKLRRAVAFLKCTKDDTRKIGAKNLKDLFTFVDAAYAVHPNMRSHTGGAISMGRGILHGKSSKQKLNVKSSTEAELVGVSDYLPYNTWLTMFLEKQGYDLKNNILFQDNQSAIRMERNGRNSCTGNSRHVSIRYFFVKDRVDKGEITVEYCPTHAMLADYFTKPLQGALFRKFRDVIMGNRTLDDLELDSVFSLKERVGK